MRNGFVRILVALFVALLAVPALTAAPLNVAVFIPGVVAGSPTYEQIVAAADKMAAAGSITSKVVEGGFNQADWPEKVTSLAATGSYDLILTTNPSMPGICADVAKDFPSQKFAVVDGMLAGNAQIYTLLYNQVEQGYFAGYLAGLVTKSTMKGANKDLKVGAIVAQEYPALTVEMIPGYTQGFKAIDSKITLDYRIVGNWYDATKGADLANSMFDSGVDVILCIAGGAGQGVIKAAQDRGKYVIYFDADLYSLAPNTIVGCATLDQARATTEVLKKAIAGSLPYGTADIVATKDGYVDFADKNPLYTKAVTKDVLDKMAVMLKQFRTGAKSLPVPKM
jgi:simple sugar transport system substrate-binding protein